MIVYIIINNINGKIYIGKTSLSLKQRFKRHCSEALSKNRLGRSNFYFHRAIVKYGKENFTIKELDNCETNEDASALEMFYIKKYKSKVSTIGYNLTDGGEGVIGRKKSKEEIEKWRKKMVGRKLSEEHKKAISIANKGKVISDDVKKKISVKNSKSKNGMYRKPETLESRKKRGEAISKSKSFQKASKITVPREKLKKVAIKRFSEKVPPNIKDEILERYKTGKCVKQDLSEEFNVPFNSIVHILRYWEAVRENLKNKPSDYQRSKIIDLRNSGSSYEKISSIVGVDKEKARNIYKVYKRKSKLLTINRCE